MNDAPLGLLFISLVILLALSAFFSSSETGMMSLNRYRLKHLSKKKHAGAKRASALLKTPDRLISLILIGNNLVNFTASAIVTVIGFRLAGDAGIAIATFIFTMVVLVFAETTPKTLAAIHPEKIAFPASGILGVLMRMMYPLVWLINSVSNFLLRILGIDLKGEGEQLSSEELRTIVGEAGPHIPKRHQAMLVNILDLEEMRVDEIMIQDQDIYCLNLEDDDAALIYRIQTCEHARVPVIDGDIDKMLGLLPLRLTTRFLSDGKLDRNMMMQQLQEPYFIPESTPLNTQLFNFQNNKRRLAIVVDEYGEIMGLITLEDILEEIVGEFSAGLAGQEDDIVADGPSAFKMNGTTHVREINKQLDWELPIDGPRTIGGLLVERLEAFPSATVALKIDNYVLEVVDIEDNRIISVRGRELPQLAD